MSTPRPGEPIDHRPVRPPLYPRLAAEMARQGYAHRHMAEVAGLSPHYMTRILNGRDVVTNRVRLAVSAELGVDAGELWRPHFSWLADEQLRGRIGVAAMVAS